MCIRDRVYIEDMYACNKEARNYYLSELMMCFNFVFNEMCHGTGSAAEMCIRDSYMAHVLPFLNLTSNIPNLALIGIMILKVGIAVMIPAWKMGRENIISER